MTRFINFLSDFGRDDEFVGVVHGVVARLAPDVTVLDVTHSVRPGDVRAGALALTRAIQYLPEGVVLAVVDPGVGTGRRAIAARTQVGIFVGPDNGLLSPAVAMVGGADRIVSIENPEMRIPSAGETFHGRDVFGPAAALLASGEAVLEDCGPDVPPDEVTPLLLPLPEVEPARITATAWWIDRFGNAQTNVSPEDMALAGIGGENTVTVRVGATDHEVPWVTAYGEVEEGDLLLHVDGSGLIALAVRGGNAAEVLRLSEGQKVTLQG
ncbi:MAG TPA: SAM-dependent chlorinase/fluorinase [Acidimicrobiia bacterium]|nr:SAM-dependent chlorinase/fluorinase [Acidimicrobiia bacterium]